MLRIKAIGLITLSVLISLTGLLSACVVQADQKTSQEEIQDNKQAAIPSNPADPTGEGVENVRDMEGTLCVVEYVGNNITFVDPLTGDVLATQNIGPNPAALVAAKDSRMLYVADSGSGQIAYVSLSDYRGVEKLRVGTTPMSIAYDENMQRLFIADYHLNSIRIMDTRLNSLIDVIPLSPKGYDEREYAPSCCTDPLDGTVLDGRRPVSLALSPDSGILYCANIGTYDISRIDLSTNSELEPFNGVIGVRDVIITPDGRSLLLAGVGSAFIEVSDLMVLDALTGDTIAEIPVGAAVGGVAQSEDGSVIAAISKDEGRLVRIDPATWTVNRERILEPGLADVVVSADGRKAYVGNSETGSVYCVDMESMELIFQAEDFADPRFLALL